MCQDEILLYDIILKSKGCSAIEKPDSIWLLVVQIWEWMRSFFEQYAYMKLKVSETETFVIYRQKLGVLNVLLNSL